MNLSSPSTPKKIDPKVFLFLGPPGGRKTTLAMQFPNVCFFDCDENLDGPRLALTKLAGAEPTFHYYHAWTDLTSGSRVDTSDVFDNLLAQIDDFKPKAQKAGIKFMCIDGLRIISEMIKQKVMRLKRKDVMETRDWDTYKTQFIKLLVVRARDTGVHTIFTCHEREVWEKSGTDMMKQVLVGYEPLLSGGIQDAFAGFFTDVWRITTDSAPGGKSEQTITTMPDTFSKYLKSSIGLPGSLTISGNQLAWPILEPYMKHCL